MKALYIASTGMKAQELNVEVISNNIANQRTAGFKKFRAEFKDLLYQDLRRVGTSTSDQGTIVPAGIQIGSGVRTAATPRIMTQGSVQPTEKPLDMAIRGEGFFQIQLPDGRTAYTRAGNFVRDAQGQIVTTDGYLVDPGVTIPENASSITISVDGTVQALLGNDSATTELGQFTLARFVNDTGLQSIGDNLYLETGSSGPAIVGAPNDEGFGNLLQGHLESSNVDAVTEISDLISAQRAYEMNSRVIRAADEMMSATTQMLS
jgi:flagellar basal-body rod protein FlgG